MIKQSRLQYKKRNNLIAWAVGIFILLLVIFKVLFPVFHIDNGMDDNFSIRNIDDKKYLELKIGGGYSFHKINIKVSGSGDDGSGNALLGSVYQDELGLYPLRGEINDREQLDEFLNIEGVEGDIKNGELIQKGNSVYFISSGKYRAFANAETFDILGFDWARIKNNKEDLLSGLQKEKNITLSTSYLEGSFVHINRELYLLGLNKRYKVNSMNEDLVKFIEEEFSIIEVSNKILMSVGSMRCKLKREDVGCVFNDDNQSVSLQSQIIVEIKDEKVLDNWDASVHTFGGGVKNMFEIALRGIKEKLRGIKEKLISKYGERIGLVR